MWVREYAGLPATLSFVALVGLLGSSPEQDEQECPGPGELLGSWSSEDVSEQDDRRVRSGPEFAESE